MTHLHLRLSAVALIALSAAAEPAVSAIFRSATPFIGVTHHQFIQAYNDTDPATRFIREVVVNTLEIDLTAPGIRVLMQGPAGVVLPTPPAAQAQGVGPTVVPEYR